MANGYVFLNEDSPFYQVFPPSGKAPVLDTVTTEVKLIGSDETQVFMLDVTRCTSIQIDQIAELSATALGGMDAAVHQQIRTIGMPIRKSQTAGTV